MLNVLYTVDTEAWPRDPKWRETRLATDIARDFDGATPDGDFGVPYQIARLNFHGLKGVFFVEALSASVIGTKPLSRMVELIQADGHEVQLHVHPEWTRWMESPKDLSSGSGNIGDYLFSEQRDMIASGVRNLRSAGCDRVRAFRAGNYGANWETLRALAENDIRFDTSFNEYYLNSDCRMSPITAPAGVPAPLQQPVEVNGVVEVPIAQFRDWPGHFRHAQVCACSLAEMKDALFDAWRNQWEYFVVVSHSFELIRNRKRTGETPRPDKTVVRRFDGLCRILGENRDKFRTVGFNEIDPASISGRQPSTRLKTKLRHTVARFGEQVVRRIR